MLIQYALFENWFCGPLVVFMPLCVHQLIKQQLYCTTVHQIRSHLQYNH